MTRITRSELHDLIWSQPAKDVAQRLGMSPEQLRAACETARIPRPGRGYWNMVNGGGKPKRVPLPDRLLGQAEHVILVDESRMGSGVRRRMLLDEPPLETPEFREGLSIVELRARALAAAAPLRKTLSNKHHAISKLLIKDEENKQRWRGHPLDAEFYPVISSTKQGRRRLLILNQLLQALSYCGAGAAKTKEPGYEWSIRIGDMNVAFELRAVGAPASEISRRHQERDDPGDLELVIRGEATGGIETEWRDSASRPLQAQMREIVAGFLIFAELSYRRGEIDRVQRLLQKRAELEATIQRHKQERLQEQLEGWKKAEEERRGDLLVEVEDWKKAHEIRAFINARLLAAEDGTPEERELSERWARWALSIADAIDPITKHRAEENDQ
ncbi:hypothetical protein [Herbaspirillum rubrisubalbicans]|nr:hypothetical protein [Herbaspirillum rubrisubalbicans]